MIDKLFNLESDSNLRQEIIKEQNILLKEIANYVSLQFLEALKRKRENTMASNLMLIKRKSIKTKFINYAQRIISSICYSLLIRINSPVIDRINYIPPLFE